MPATALKAGEPQRVEVAGIGLVLFRNGEDVVAVGERCPHLGAPMSDAWIDRGRIVCPWHGSQFEVVSGQVAQGPATAPLPCYPTRLREGTIEVRDGATQAVGVAIGVGQ
jgi:nitrite reductase/ring-hydroxylating ferredoxin subunit